MQSFDQKHDVGSHLKYRYFVHAVILISLKFAQVCALCLNVGFYFYIADKPIIMIIMWTWDGRISNEDIADNKLI